jgi:DNA adenine methylase
MIISINDHADIRAIFGHLPCKEIDYEYTVGGSERASSCVELVLGNWENGVPEPAVLQRGLFSS